MIIIMLIIKIIVKIMVKQNNGKNKIMIIMGNKQKHINHNNKIIVKTQKQIIKIMLINK